MRTTKPVTKVWINPNTTCKIDNCVAPLKVRHANLRTENYMHVCTALLTSSKLLARVIYLFFACFDEADPAALTMINRLSLWNECMVKNLVIRWKRAPAAGSYLHHQQQRIEHDERHDEIFKRRRDHHSPDFVFQTVTVLGHVSLQRLGLNGEIDTRFLHPPNR